MVENMIALCSVSGRNFDISFLASLVCGGMGTLAWVMIVMLAVVLLYFVCFVHLVIGFGDHFWVLLRDTVFFLNVILYLIAHFIFLMLFVMLDLLRLSGCMVLRFMHVHMRLIMVMRVSVIAKISFERAFVTCWWRWLDVCAILWVRCCLVVDVLLRICRASRDALVFLIVSCMPCIAVSMTACVLVLMHW